MQSFRIIISLYLCTSSFGKFWPFQSMQQLFDFVYFTARDLFDAPDNERLNRSVAELVEFEAKMAMVSNGEISA